MQGATVVPPLAQALGPWHDYYELLGTASATMVGLLFVAVTVGSGAFSSSRRAALRVFLSASLVNFGLILVACLIVLAPIRNWLLLGLAVLGCGLFGLTHAGLACRDTLRDGLYKRIDLEDRVWYLVMPLLGYLLMVGSGAALAWPWERGCAVLAFAVGLLLVVGLHNAWDITVWSMTRRRD
jgi:hypothetical protein